MALIDFTLSNARRFYSSMGNPLGWKGLKQWDFFPRGSFTVHESKMANCQCSDDNSQLVFVAI